MNSLNKTFLPTKNYKNRNWYLIDCKGQTLGRLATLIAGLLKGKNRPQYHPSVDTGDYIVLINADLIIINQTSKHYLVSNPGRPGHSLKIRNAADCLPKLTIERAVKRMLANTEAKRLMRRLKSILPKIMGIKHRIQERLILTIYIQAFKWIKFIFESCGFESMSKSIKNIK